MNTNSVNYERIYNIGLLDDLHNYFPDILYEPSRFESVRDLCRYIQDCTIDRFNLDNRNLREFVNLRRNPRPTEPLPAPMRPRPVQPRLPVQTVTETIDITSFLTPSLRLPRATNPIVNPWEDMQIRTENLTNNFLLNVLNNLVQQDDLMTDVPVFPTSSQIEQATTLRSATSEDEGNDSVCNICLASYTSSDTIRTIRHCGHYFHQNCIDHWFEQNVHCPVCRFDIREAETRTSAQP